MKITVSVNCRGLFACWEKLKNLYTNHYIIKSVLVDLDHANNAIPLLGLCFNTAHVGLGICLTMDSMPQKSDSPEKISCSSDVAATPWTPGALRKVVGHFCIRQPQIHLTLTL